MYGSSLLPHWKTTRAQNHENRDSFTKQRESISLECDNLPEKLQKLPRKNVTLSPKHLVSVILSPVVSSVAARCFPNNGPTGLKPSSSPGAAPSL